MQMVRLIVTKVQLVAKGYSQVEGINYDKTFVPVARYSSI